VEATNTVQNRTQSLQLLWNLKITHGTWTNLRNYIGRRIRCSQQKRRSKEDRSNRKVQVLKSLDRFPAIVIAPWKYICSSTKRTYFATFTWYCNPLIPSFRISHQHTWRLQIEGSMCLKLRSIPFPQSNRGLHLCKFRKPGMHEGRVGTHRQQSRDRDFSIFAVGLSVNCPDASVSPDNIIDALCTHSGFRYGHASFYKCCHARCVQILLLFDGMHNSGVLVVAGYGKASLKKCWQ